MADCNPRALALFDFDGTLIKGDSIVSFIRLARRLNAFPRREYRFIFSTLCRYLLRNLSLDATKTRALRFLNFLPKERKDALEKAFALEELLPRIYPEALEEIKRHKEEGRILALVSASTENYMRYVAPALGFDALLCTPCSPGGLVGPNCKGDEKIRRIQRWLEENRIIPDYANSYAYGDSLSDLPMLQLAGHPVLVNPKKRLIQAAPQTPRVQWGKK